MLVDKNKRVLLHWELNRFFLANSGMKIFTGIYTVLSTNMAALSSCSKPVISLQIRPKKTVIKPVISLQIKFTLFIGIIRSLNC